jgi:predicted acetyltransferase
LPVSIRDAHRVEQDRDWIQTVYRDYLEDLSRVSMNTGAFPVMGEFGDREPDLMARWFADDSSHPLLILHDRQPAGFALVSRPTVPQRQNIDFRMAEFFVIASRRRLGVGRDAATLIFNRFAGRWEITEFQRNAGAIVFWRRIVADYTQGRYQEATANGEVRQVFRSSDNPPRPRGEIGRK